MAMTDRQLDVRVKALQAHMASLKNDDANALYEWELSCNTNNRRGNVISQKQVKVDFPRYRDSRRKVGCGYSKVTWLDRVNEDGDIIDFDYVVVKRHSEFNEWKTRSSFAYGWVGNQLDKEINCYEEIAMTNPAGLNLICPVLKYFRTKSDKNNPCSVKGFDNIIIIAQRAEYVDDYKSACFWAQGMNEKEGYNGESAQSRMRKIERFSSEMGWDDVLENDGNCGVIFNYAKQCYEAVVIDYAL